jgi:hypothetical protein
MFDFDQCVPQYVLNTWLGADSSLLFNKLGVRSSSFFKNLSKDSA